MFKSPAVRSLTLVGVWLALSGASGWLLADAQRDERAEAESRWELRADVVAKSVDSYVADFFAQERRVAKRLLAPRRPSGRDFDGVVTLLGAQAAVLLDGRGRLLDMAPRDPQLVGTNLAARYDHLESAVAGRHAVSNVVPSAGRGVPVVAFAVPFFAAGRERRVFSGAFDIKSTPLAAYLGRSAALPPNRAYLADAAGEVFATNDPEIRSGDFLPSDLGEDVFAVQSQVRGTPWRLVMVSPHSTLYAGTAGVGRVVPWVLWAGFVLAGMVSVLLVARLLRSREKLGTLNRRLHDMANRDILTGLANRRGTQRRLEREIASARRYGHPLSVLTLDVDRFKEVNDAHGHATGDLSLRSVADAISASVREVDLAGRWGGDEFLVVMPHIGGAGAEAAAERLNEQVRRSPLIADGALVNVSVSIGCAQWRDETAESLVRRADEALFEVKRTGRDGHSSASTEPQASPSTA